MSRPTTWTKMRNLARATATFGTPVLNGAVRAPADLLPVATLRPPANALKGRPRRIRRGAESSPGVASAGARPNTTWAGTQRRQSASRWPCPLTAVTWRRGLAWPTRWSSWAGTTMRLSSTEKQRIERDGMMRRRLRRQGQSSAWPMPMRGSASTRRRPGAW